MSMREIHLGRRAELEGDIQTLDVKIQSHRETLHERCDPLRRLADFDANGLTVLSAVLEDLTLQRKAAADELAAINRELGCRR